MSIVLFFSSGIVDEVASSGTILARHQCHSVLVLVLARWTNRTRKLSVELLPRDAKDFAPDLSDFILVLARIAHVATRLFILILVLSCSTFYAT